MSGRPNISTDYAKETLNLARPVTDETLNAANLYQKAIDAYKEPPNIEDEDLIRAIKAKRWIDELTSEQLDLLKQHINDNAQTIDLFTQASQKPYYWLDKTDPNNPPLIYMLIPELKPIRNITRMMAWQAKLKAHAGDIEGAFDDIFTLYRSGEHLKGPRILIEQLVGMVVQAIAAETSRAILANTNIDSNTLQSIQRKFTDLKNKAVFVADFQTEKFLFLDFVQRCYTDNGRGSGHMIPRMVKKYYGALGNMNPSFTNFDVMPLLGIAIVSVDRADMTKMVNKFYDTFQKHADKSPWQLKEEKFDFEMGLNQWSLVKQIRHISFVTFLPSYSKVSRTMHETKADIDSLITTIAILRFQKQKGFYPQNLQQLLDETFINELPLDPFSNNKPLVYKKTDDSFILYSLSENFTDDGGKVYRYDGRVRVWEYYSDAVFWPLQK